jgi:DNA-sulfur modification-associated
MAKYSGEPVAEITHLREVDDAGVTHYEGVFTANWIDNAEAEGILKLAGNIRPDWQSGSKPTAKTKRKVDRWTEELLKNNAVIGNLSIRLDPTEADFEIVRDDDEDFTIRLWSGCFDTGVDSQSRFASILNARRNPVGTFRNDTKFAVRIWMADDELAARVGSDYNTRGDKVNDTAAKYAYQDNAEKRIARRLLEGSPHLGVDNVEVLKNTVSASSSKLFAFNTLTQAMESYWKADPVNSAEEESQAQFLVKFWDELVALRREFGRLGKSDRQALRGTSMAGTALSVHGVIAVADEVYRQRLDAAEVLSALGEPVYHNGEAIDYFSYQNPIWAKTGALVTSQDKAGNNRLTLRMSFQTRKAVADELKRQVGLAEAR